MPVAGPQDDSIAFLSDSATHGGAEVTCVSTHGNLIFLAGDTAWKIKRAVRYPYTDFSSLELRRKACEAELEINRQFAPDLYLGVRPITREQDGRITFAGSGPAIEWAVQMRRFDQSDLLSARADAGRLVDADAKAVADLIVRSHRDACRSHDLQGHARLERVLEPVIHTLARDWPDAGASVWAEMARERLETCREILDARARDGLVRRCHGDLHAANIVISRDGPVLYDAIEFDPEIATVDVLYDLAFLLMDLCRRNAAGAANVVLNRYLWRSGENIGGLAVLPLFMSVRAAIRAMVTAERAGHSSGNDRTAQLNEARGLLDLGTQLLRPSPPRLIAVAGLSGTGKSTLAARLAPAVGALPGAVHVRSDLVRKTLWNVEETERLPESAYSPEAAARVYAEVIERAGRALQSGASVIIDAVSLLESERTAFAELAKRLHVRFDGLWLEGPEAVLTARVEARTGDASDATSRVVREQALRSMGALTEGWRRIAAGGCLKDTVEAAHTALGLPYAPIASLLVDRTGPQTP